MGFCLILNLLFVSPSWRCAMHCDRFSPLLTLSPAVSVTLLSLFSAVMLLGKDHFVCCHTWWKGCQSCYPITGKDHGTYRTYLLSPPELHFSHTMVSLKCKLRLPCCSGRTNLVPVVWAAPVVLFFTINSRLTSAFFLALMFIPLHFSACDASFTCKAVQMHPKNSCH